MKLLHNIGKIDDANYNTREEVFDCDDELSFDGVYLNVYQNQDILKYKKGIFFVMGDFLGKDNKFDLKNVPQIERFCTLKQVDEMCDKYNFEIGWHTWSHRDLTKLSENEIMHEITPPITMKYFAYPYGTFNEKVVECVRKAGYKKAWSVGQGNNNPLTLYRDYL